MSQNIGISIKFAERILQFLTDFHLNPILGNIFRSHHLTGDWTAHSSSMNSKYATNTETPVYSCAMSRNLEPLDVSA